MANLTVEEFTESIAKQISSDLKLEGTDLVNRLVSSLSKGLLDKIVQKQITLPIPQQSVAQTEQVAESVSETDKTTLQANKTITEGVPQIAEGISKLTSQFKQSFLNLSEDFKKSLGETNSIFKNVTEHLDKLVDSSSSPQKDDKFPLSIKHRFNSLEKHLTNTFGTKSDKKIDIEPLKIEDSVNQLQKTVIDNFVEQQQDQKQENVKLKDSSEKTYEVLKSLLNSSETIAKSRTEKSESRAFFDSFKKIPDVVDAKILDGIYKILPKALTTKVTSLLNPVEKKEEKKETKEETKTPDTTPPTTKSFLEQSKEVQSVNVQGFSEEAFGQLSNNLPAILKNSFEGMDKNIEKIVKILEKIPNLLEQIQDSTEESGGGLIDNVISMAAGGALLKMASGPLGKIASKIPGLSKVLPKVGGEAAETVAKKGAKEAAETVTKKGAKEAAETVTKKGAKEAAETVTKKGAGEAVETVAKKGAAEAAETVAKKGGAKLAGKTIAKTAGKSLLKKIPLVGLGLGGLFAVQRAMSGDWTGAGLELASGAAGTIPGVGTAASIGLDAALLARDIKKEENVSEEAKEEISPTTSPIPEVPQNFTPLQPKPETPVLKEQDLTVENQINNKSLEQIASNTASTNQNIANLVVGFNNLAKALESFGVNVSKQQPTVVNNVVSGGKSQSPQINPSQFANLGNNEISTFRANFVETPRFVPA